MKKTMLGLVSAALGAAILSFVMITSRAAEAPADQPPFVDKESWVSVAPDLGIVVTASGAMTGAAAPVAGYFMVKRGGLWRRLDVEQPARLKELR